MIVYFCSVIMLSSQRYHHLLTFLFLLLGSLFASVTAQYCINNGNYTTNSTYQNNLRTLLSTLSTSVDRNGFYNASVGGSPNRAYAIVLCRGDIQLDFCRSCIQNATVDLVQACPNQMQAILWHEFCMLRYSNASSIGTMDISPATYMWNVQNSTRPDQFMSDLGTLLGNISIQASNGGSLRKVAYGSTPSVGFQTIYALEQCTPDLSAEDCSSCLNTAAQVVPRNIYGAIGARVLQPSCNLRYEVRPFYNETRLQEFISQPVPRPPVASPVPVASPTPGSSTKT